MLSFSLPSREVHVAEGITMYHGKEWAKLGSETGSDAGLNNSAGAPVLGTTCDGQKQ